MNQNFIKLNQETTQLKLELYRRSIDCRERKNLILVKEEFLC